MLAGEHINDQMALVRMDTHGWVELAALAGESRQGGDGLEDPNQTIDGVVGLLDRPRLGGVSPNIIEIVVGARREAVRPRLIERQGARACAV